MKTKRPQYPSAHEVMLRSPIYTQSEREFVRDVERAADLGVGFGFMQQVAEWEWLHRHGHGWGPNYFGRRIEELEKQVVRLERALARAKGKKR